MRAGAISFWRPESVLVHREIEPDAVGKSLESFAVGWVGGQRHPVYEIRGKISCIFSQTCLCRHIHLLRIAFLVCRLQPRKDEFEARQGGLLEFVPLIPTPCLVLERD